MLWGWSAIFSAIHMTLIPTSFLLTLSNFQWGFP
jgi:hypothetical protein